MHELDWLDFFQKIDSSNAQLEEQVDSICSEIELKNIKGHIIARSYVTQFISETFEYLIKTL